MNWNDYFANLATAAATKSKDSTQVGAILVDHMGSVRLTAFNGPPRGVKDKPERFARPTKYLFACHAEQNIVSFAARNGIPTDGCTIYVTHIPCSSCAKTLVQAGIIDVRYGPGQRQIDQADFDAAATIFAEAHVSIKPWDD